MCFRTRLSGDEVGEYLRLTFGIGIIDPEINSG